MFILSLPYLSPRLSGYGPKHRDPSPWMMVKIHLVFHIFLMQYSIGVLHEVNAAAQKLPCLSPYPQQTGWRYLPTTGRTKWHRISPSQSGIDMISPSEKIKERSNLDFIVSAIGLGRYFQLISHVYRKGKEKPYFSFLFLFLEFALFALEWDGACRCLFLDLPWAPSLYIII